MTLALVSVGCATILHQGERRSAERGFLQRIDVTSVPPGSTVILDGQDRGVTPLAIHVDRRRKDAVVRLQLEGYRPVDIPLTRKVGGAVIADVALGLFALNPLFGLEKSGPSQGTKLAIGVALPAAALLTDFVSGAVYTHESKVSVRLVPIGPAGDPSTRKRQPRRKGTRRPSNLESRSRIVLRWSLRSRSHSALSVQSAAAW